MRVGIMFYLLRGHLRVVHMGSRCNLRVVHMGSRGNLRVVHMGSRGHLRVVHMGSRGNLRVVHMGSRGHLRVVHMGSRGHLRVLHMGSRGLRTLRLRVRTSSVVLYWGISPGCELNAWWRHAKEKYSTWRIGTITITITRIKYHMPTYMYYYNVICLCSLFNC